jgi:hypothetical protein
MRDAESVGEIGFLGFDAYADAGNGRYNLRAVS